MTKRRTRTGADGGHAAAAERSRTASASLGGRAIAAGLVAAAFLLSGASSTAAAGTTEEAEALVDRVASNYESSSSYRIDFVQDSFWALADSLQRTVGFLLAEPPSLIAIRYDDGGRIASNGESLWVFVPQTNQFFSAAVDSADVAIDPARLLRRYRPDASAPFADTAPGTRTVVLRPAVAIAEPSKLTVTIDEDRAIVTALVAYSASGDRTTYRMLDTTFGVAIEPSEFAPNRPTGVDFVRGQMSGTP